MSGLAQSTGGMRRAGIRRSGAVAILAALAVAAAVLPGAVVAQPADAASSIRDREYWLDDYGIRDAWKVSKGAGVTVAVIDTGVDGSHPDLTGAVVDGTDFSGQGDTDGETPVGDDASHGTMVASLLAGRGSSGGMTGVAPRADILAISIGFGSTSNSDDQIAEAVTWAVDHGADVINMSLTRNTPDWPESWDKAFLYAMEHDVVVVAAAGNRGSGTTAVGAPATMPGVLTVAGLDRDGDASWDASSQGITIGVSAPSEQLVGAVPGGGYVLWDGTSGAAPIVAGVVALVRSAHPGLDAADVINRVVRTATPAGEKGVDPIYGFGRLDAEAAVSEKVSSVSENPMGELTEWIRLYRRAEVTPAPTDAATEEPGEPGDTATDDATGGVGIPESPDGPGDGSVDDPTEGSAYERAAAREIEEVGIPLLLFAGFGTALLVLIFSASRYFRRRFGARPQGEYIER